MTMEENVIKYISFIGQCCNNKVQLCLLRQMSIKTNRHLVAVICTSEVIFGRIVSSHLA